MIIIRHDRRDCWTLIHPPRLPADDRDTLIAAVASFSFLVNRGETLTGQEWAARIRSHSAHPRAALVAETIERHST